LLRIQLETVVILVLKFMTISLEEEQHGEDEMQDVDANVNTLDEEVWDTLAGWLKVRPTNTVE
jgi:hypothetical protein